MDNVYNFIKILDHLLTHFPDLYVKCKYIITLDHLYSPVHLAVEKNLPHNFKNAAESLTLCSSLTCISNKYSKALHFSWAISLKFILNLLHSLFSHHQILTQSSKLSWFLEYQKILNFSSIFLLRISLKYYIIQLFIKTTLLSGIC